MTDKSNKLRIPNSGVMRRIREFSSSETDSQTHSARILARVNEEPSEAFDPDESTVSPTDLDWEFVDESDEST